MQKKQSHPGFNCKSIFSANFKESNHIVEKNKMQEIVESVNIELVVKWLVVNIVFILLNIMMYFIDFCVIWSQNISNNSLSILYKLALYSTLILIICFIPQFIYTFFPNKKAYKFYITRVLSTQLSSLSIVFAFIPMMLGISYGYSTTLGIFLLFAYVFFMIYIVIKERSYYYQKLYNDTKSLNNFTQKFIYWTTLLSKKYGGWLIAVAILLKSIFNHENMSFFKSIENGIYAIIFILLSFVMIKVMIGLVYSDLIQLYYINKYPEEYRQLYKYSKEEWYGKRYRKLGE